MHSGVHDIDALNADVDVGTGVDQFFDIELVLATECAGNEVGVLPAIAFGRTRPARYCTLSI